LAGGRLGANRGSTSNEGRTFTSEFGREDSRIARSSRTGRLNG